MLLIASVHSEDEAVCKSSTHMTVLETEGYLSNMVADETGCGAPHAPWRIKAKPGVCLQRTFFVMSNPHQCMRAVESNPHFITTTYFCPSQSG